MKEIVEFIQKKVLKNLKKNIQKSTKINIIPIIEFINESNNKILIGGSQGIGKSSFIHIIIKTLEKIL